MQQPKKPWAPGKKSKYKEKTERNKACETSFSRRILPEANTGAPSISKPKHQKIQPQISTWPVFEEPSLIRRCYYLLVRLERGVPQVVVMAYKDAGDGFRRLPNFTVHIPMPRKCESVAVFGSSYVSDWYSVDRRRLKLDCHAGGYLPAATGKEPPVVQIWTMAFCDFVLRSKVTFPSRPVIEAEWADISVETVLTLKPSVASIFSIASNAFKRLFPGNDIMFDEVAEAASRHCMAHRP